MTEAPPRAGGLRRLGGMIAESYRLAPRSFVAAPALVALAVVPEAVQHVAEIRLGMFESAAAFRALSDDATRWAFGYVKVAGLLMAMLSLARFWALGSVRAAVLVPPRDLLRIVPRSESPLPSRRSSSGYRHGLRRRSRSRWRPSRRCCRRGCWCGWSRRWWASAR